MAKKIIVVSNPGGGKIEVYSDIAGDVEVEVFWPRKDDPKNEQSNVSRRINGEAGMKHLYTATER